MSKRRYFCGDVERSLEVGRIPDQIYRLLYSTYPATWTPKGIAFHLHVSHAAVKKAVRQLLKKGMVQRPKGTIQKTRGFYQGVLGIDNAAGLEDPEIKMHNLTLQVILKKPLRSPLNPHTPPSLYTLCPHDIGSRRAVSWSWNGWLYPVSLQFNAASVTVDLQCSKRPLSQHDYIHYENWLLGMLQGVGVNVSLCDLYPVKFELNKDYELLTITPKSLTIRDLRDKSFFRIYMKYRNLTRMEVGTTWNGDKKLYNLFFEFGKAPPELKGLDDKDRQMYG